MNSLKSINIQQFRLAAALTLSLAIHGFLVLSPWENSLFPPINRGAEKKQLTIHLRALPPVEVQPAPNHTDPPKIEKKIKEPLVQTKKEIEPQSQKTEPVPLPVEEPKTIEKPEVVQEKITQEIIETLPKTPAEPESVEFVAEDETKFPPAPAIQLARPIYKANKQPPYPLRARKRGYQGTVLFDVFVTIDGLVGDIRIKQSSGHDLLDKAAFNTVKGWNFTPSKKGLVPVALWVTVPVTFKLQ